VERERQNSRSVLIPASVTKPLRSVPALRPRAASSASSPPYSLMSAHCSALSRRICRAAQVRFPLRFSLFGFMITVQFIDRPIFKFKYKSSKFGNLNLFDIRTLLSTINHFSGPHKTPGRVCVCLRSKTFERKDRWPRYLACWFILILSGSSSRFKVTGQNSWSQDENVLFRLQMHVAGRDEPTMSSSLC